MSYNAIPAGNSVPEDINVIIEIPANSDPVKYEVDKDLDALVVDRFMPTAMFYPANYGFIPNTLAGDGDPVDVLVITPYPLVAGSVIRSRPVAVLWMEDEKGEDEKIIAVPHSSLTKIYDNIQDVGDIPTHLQDQINHFFESYKNLEKDKWVKIKDQWLGKKEALEIIKAALPK